MTGFAESEPRPQTSDVSSSTPDNDADLRALIKNPAGYIQEKRELNLRVIREEMRRQRKMIEHQRKLLDRQRKNLDIWRKRAASAERLKRAELERARQRARNERST